MTNKNLFLLVATASLFAACSKNDNNGTTPPPAADSDTISVRGTISANTTWSKDKVYRLRGYVYVDAPATLTIEAGTQIISNRDSAGVLVIYKGAKIMANGTKDAPIVFTSAHTDKQPGDLGGVVLIGKATGNGNHAEVEGDVNAAHKAFGGNDDHDNSGVLKYVRIEYGGKATAPNDEINGLSLYAVGDGTEIDYVQVIRGLDDAFEFFGGTVNAKHLIAYRCADDDFDFDDGYRGKIQYAISIKDPAFTDDKTKGDISNNFEVDNTNGTSKPYTATPITHPILSNFTAVGPNNAANTSASYGYGMRWRRGAQFEMANSIVVGGQLAGLDLDDDLTATYYKTGISKFENSFLHAVKEPFKIDKLVDAAVWTAADLKLMVEGANMSKLFTNPADIKLTDPFNIVAPNVKPQAGSVALTTTGKFTGGLDHAFFDKTSFVGAMDATNDWTATWAKFGN
ncbi:hypothetical protein [Chitinophaga sp. MM2321]|uniref:hypothetical protein n=1 Tax=Chitinophaga sp. MM2321 TaxID=3137178 RepID=UPI0032D5A13D